MFPNGSNAEARIESFPVPPKYVPYVGTGVPADAVADSAQNRIEGKSILVWRIVNRGNSDRCISSVTAPLRANDTS
jgi:hypothetical protein